MPLKWCSKCTWQYPIKGQSLRVHSYLLVSPHHGSPAYTVSRTTMRPLICLQNTARRAYLPCCSLSLGKKEYHWANSLQIHNLSNFFMAFPVCFSKFTFSSSMVTGQDKMVLFYYSRAVTRRQCSAVQCKAPCSIQKMS